MWAVGDKVMPKENAGGTPICCLLQTNVLEICARRYRDTGYVVPGLRYVTDVPGVLILSSWVSPVVSLLSEAWPSQGLFLELRHLRARLTRPLWPELKLIVGW